MTGAARAREEQPDQELDPANGAEGVALVRAAPTEMQVYRPEDLSACRSWIAQHSKSFYLSSLLLPRAARHGSWALYAFCRRADDAVDQLGDPREVALARVSTLRRRLDAVYGRGDQGHEPALQPALIESMEPIDRAYLEVARTAGIPRQVAERFLNGMEMDARGTRYRTWDELLGYCFNVASTVGLMMTQLMGHTGEDQALVLVRAADLGLGMQLTNIARDVGEDARRGRVYLPDELLDRHGASREEVLRLGEAGLPPSAGVAGAVRALLLQADRHYAAADRAIRFLPARSRPAIYAARLIYAAIGAQVARRGFDSITGRAVVPLWGKLRLVLRALLRPPSGDVAADRLGGGPADALMLRCVQEVGLVPAPAGLLG